MQQGIDSPATVATRQRPDRSIKLCHYDLGFLYWGIGRDILTRQQSEGWGAKVVDRLAHDLLKAFPGMTAFGARNLKYMRAFAEAYPDQQFCATGRCRIALGT